MKKFNIAKNSDTIIFGVRIPAGAIYGKINGTIYYMTSTHEKSKGIMSYYTINEKGHFKIVKNVCDDITIFVSNTLEKYDLRSQGVLYADVRKQAEKEYKRKQSEKLVKEREEREKAEHNRILKESAMRDFEKDYKNQRELSNLMQDCITKKKHRHSSTDSQKNKEIALDLGESAICNFSQKRLGELRYIDKRLKECF